MLSVNPVWCAIPWTRLISEYRSGMDMVVVFGEMRRHSQEIPW